MIRSARPPYLLRKYYSELVWRVNTKEKKLFLTFDDGPDPEVTPFVLETLAAKKAKATFFCIGKNAAANTDLVKRIREEGHALGNHTYDHPNGWKTSDNTYLENVNRCDDLSGSKLFRPPYGRIRRSQIKALKEKYSIVMWDVLSWDFDQAISPEKCLKMVCAEAREGSIIVFHDRMKAKRNMEYALPRTLEYFSEKGYCFERL